MTLSIANTDSDENPFLIFFKAVHNNAPEINLLLNGGPAGDGAIGVLGGGPFATPSVNVTITLQNTGTADLELT